ncbi:MAG: hypothetical protein V4461_11185 [Pseudomonadota bacterium]
MTIIVIHGPMATGKTRYKQAFAKHYGCTSIVDNWCAREHEFPEDGRLVLTTSHPDEIARQFTEDLDDWFLKYGVDGGTDPDLRIIDITTARSAIGVAPHAPNILDRLSH